MNITPGTGPELDSFDRALLTELRGVVAEREVTPVRRSRRRWSVTVGGVAAATVAAFGVASLNPAAAYAVERTHGGDIVISIKRLDDAAGLEKALADYGIEADVDYDAESSTFSDQSGDLPSELTPLEGREEEKFVGDPGDLADTPCGDLSSMPLTTDLRGDEYVITIPEGSVLTKQDSVLQIRTAGSIEGSFAGLDVGYAVDGVRCGFGTATASAVPAG